ncbi:MAG: hypothetical protein GQ577_05615, partial [Woeseiaceae bacterium]|nr:hypothetical protein [Woeseiaceae bacterium]
GVTELLKCHTLRENFIMTVSPDELSAEQRATFDGGANYISEYNRVLSRWWEQERSSCE